jgi:hypothetical protein
MTAFAVVPEFPQMYIFMAIYTRSKNNSFEFLIILPLLFYPVMTFYALNLYMRSGKLK